MKNGGLFVGQDVAEVAEVVRDKKILNICGICKLGLYARMALRIGPKK